MLNDFLIFAAPLIVIIAAIIISFWAAKNDNLITNDEN
ncbi:cytochrome bd oxidase small subunit CydS [Oceanobacillus chungangensis]